MTEPPKTMKELFIFLYLKVIAILKTAIKIVRQSVTESLPIEKQTEIIMVTEAIFTASRKAENNIGSLLVMNNDEYQGLVT